MSANVLYSRHLHAFVDSHYIMSKKHMRKYSWSIVIVLTLLLVYFVMENRAGYEVDDMKPIESLGPTPTSKTGTTASGLTIVNVTPKISYTQATQKYVNRMQINSTCNIAPAPNIVLKNGATVMFDNRSETAKTIALNSYKFSIKGYGWVALTLKAGKPPLTISIDCDKGQNNATILLEK